MDYFKIYTQDECADFISRDFFEIAYSPVGQFAMRKAHLDGVSSFIKISMQRIGALLISQPLKKPRTGYERAMLLTELCEQKKNIQMSAIIAAHTSAASIVKKN